MAAPLQVTAEQLRAESLAMFPRAHVICLDADYNLPTHDSLKKWGHFSWEKLAGFGITSWKAFFDCDKYSLFYKVMAALMHYAAWCFGRATATGVAVGVLIYHVGGRPESCHMINVVRTERGIEPYEPQKNATFALTDAERASATFLLW